MSLLSYKNLLLWLMWPTHWCQSIYICQISSWLFGIKQMTISCPILPPCFGPQSSLLKCLFGATDCETIKIYMVLYLELCMYYWHDHLQKASPFLFLIGVPPFLKGQLKPHLLRVMRLFWSHGTQESSPHSSWHTLPTPRPCLLKPSTVCYYLYFFVIP